jgi:hypothetical protein
MNFEQIIIQQANLFNLNINESVTKHLIDNKLMIYDDLSIINLNSQDSFEIEKITWIYNNNNFRIPYINEKKILVIKVNESNILNFISSASLINDENIICGEKIQYLADVVVGTNNKISYNPNNVKFSKKLVNIDHITFSELDSYKKIFVFTDNLLLFYDKFGDNINLSNKTIISHNSDDEINTNFVDKLNKVNKQFSQNCLIRHNNLISIPIGIENRQWFDHDIFHRVRKMNIPKTKDVYFLFSLGTHASRSICFNSLISKLEWSPKVSKEEYFKELKRHRYAICPRGNGLDTHRLWECLYLDVIPIMISSDFINIDNLPIIVYNNWDEFEKSKLYNNFSNQLLEKITLEYYKKLI